MTTFKQRIYALGLACFDIEKDLEIFDCLSVDNNEQYLRRALYRVRIELSGLQRYAEMVDEETKNDNTYSKN